MTLDPLIALTCQGIAAVARFLTWAEVEGTGGRSPDFIDAVGATTATFPVGYRNRFGHPKADIVERYRAKGTSLWRTDADGALTVQLSGEGLSVAAEREQRCRYWHTRSLTRENRE